MHNLYTTFFLGPLSNPAAQLYLLQTVGELKIKINKVLQLLTTLNQTARILESNNITDQTSSELLEFQFPLTNITELETCEEKLNGSVEFYLALVIYIFIVTLHFNK